MVGAGGGSSGQTMPNNTQYSNRSAGIGGTQTTGFALGQGESSTSDNLRGGGRKRLLWWKSRRK
ncbi:hypothetical protein D3C72_1371040 [compost metagenome]